MSPLLPALLLALFAAWSGSFHGAASFSGAVSGQLALVAAAFWGWRRAADPLRLGRDGRLLLLALGVTLAASAWASPVPRAARVGLTLLPAYLLLPAAVARSWAGERGRRWGPRAVAAVLGGAALWGLAGWLLGSSPRAALPVGHHNLLAAWLVTLWPLAALAARPSGGGWRWAGAAAALAALAALAATGSLLGWVALAVQLLALAWGYRRWRPWALAAALAALATRLPRWAALAAGTDPSLLARRVYLEAGWAGWLERPFLGWGPGSVPWTAGLFLAPVPGVSPPGEAVGQLHCLPLELAYEAGAPALLLAAAVAVLFAFRRRAELTAGLAADPLLLRAGLLGLAGAGVTALGNAWLTVPALPVAVGLAAGASLAGAASGPDGSEPAATGPGADQVRRAGRRIGHALVAAYGLVVAVALLSPDRALRHYEQARLAATLDAARSHLERAAALDPAFPLYRARAAGYAAGDAPELSRAAARAAPGVAVLWLSAGVQAVAAGSPWAGDALARAQALDPLGGLAPFFRLVADPAGPDAPRCGARALLGEPRLAAAVFWEGREPLLAAALEEVRAWSGVDPGWRLALAAAAAPPLAAEGPVAELAVGSEEGPEALSLHAFRRRPWGAPWFSLPVRERRLPPLDLPPASTLAASAPEAFPAASCSPL